MNRALRKDDGLSLIELIIVVVLVGILGGATVMIFVNSWTTQSTVMSTTQATNRGQLMGQSIEKAARDADAIRITSDGRYIGFRVAHNGGAYTCAAFMIRSASPADSFVSMSASPLLTPSATTWPQPWLANNVQVNGSSPYFALNTAGVFPVITYTFKVTTSSAPVAISGQAAGRTQNTIVSTDTVPKGASPCW